MSAIDNYLQEIKTAVYGEEVRDAIHDAIEQCHDDVEGVQDAVEQCNEDVEDLALNKSVRYDTKQTLTNEQKRLARDNIGVTIDIPTSYNMKGADLSTVFSSASAFHDALAAEDYSKIRIGDYWLLRLSGTFRDYGSYTIPSGTSYYSDSTLTTLVGTTSQQIFEGSYKSDTVVSFGTSSTYYCAISDCLNYFERTMSNVVVKLEVAGINNYWRYGDTGDLIGNKPHITFVSRDCLPFYIKMRKESGVWENVVTTQTFAGNGSTKQFVLSNSSNRIGDVYVDGVKKKPDTDYTIGDYYVRFTAAPESGAVITIDALDSANPWRGTALFKTLNDPNYGVLPIIAQTSIGAYIYAGPNNKGMRARMEIKNPGLKEVRSTLAWDDRGKLFLPFESEIWGHPVWSDNSPYGLGVNLQYPIFGGSRRHISKGIGNEGPRNSWCTASSCSGSSDNFCYVGNTGIPDRYAASAAYGPPVCFVMV